MKSVGIFGASGFVGTAVREQLLGLGGSSSGKGNWKAVNFSRTERKGKEKEEEWCKADANDPETYKNKMKELDAVLISIGSPPLPTFSQHSFLRKKRENGDVCVKVMQTAKEAGVKHLILINASMPSFTPAAYKLGKMEAEHAARDFAKDSKDARVTVLYPAAINGTRRDNGIPIPIFLVLSPISFLLKGMQNIGVTDKIYSAIPSLVNALDPMPNVNQVAATVVEELNLHKESRGFFQRCNADILKK